MFGINRYTINSCYFYHYKLFKKEVNVLPLNNVLHAILRFIFNLFFIKEVDFGLEKLPYE